MSVCARIGPGLARGAAWNAIRQDSRWAGPPCSAPAGRGSRGRRCRGPAAGAGRHPGPAGTPRPRAGPACPASPMLPPPPAGQQPHIPCRTQSLCSANPNAAAAGARRHQHHFGRTVRRNALSSPQDGGRSPERWQQEGSRGSPPRGIQSPGGPSGSGCEPSAPRRAPPAHAPG